MNNVSHEKVEEVLTGTPLTIGYKPTLPIDTMFGVDGLPIFQFRRDIEYMLMHPQVMASLNYFKSGIAGAEFWGGQNPLEPDDEHGLPISEDEGVAAFVSEQCERYWDRGVPQLQAGYDYGWIGAENRYVSEEVLRWDGLDYFSPRDVFLLTQDHNPVGVRVKNIRDKGEVDLWMASDDIPAKGLWYVHNPRYQKFYGQSQLMPAWRPWRRLAWKDGLESTLDMGYYRCGFMGPQIGYPEEDIQAPLGQPGVPAPPATTLDSQGRPRRYMRDLARMIGEQAKSGATIGFPTTSYPKEQGGGKKWEINWPVTNFDGAKMMEGIKNLHDQISYGIGVPPELLQAAETGSGYSGRRIPLESFLDGQQRIGDAFLHLFVEQVLKPLVKWNFGDMKWTVKLKRFIKTKAKDNFQKPPEQPGQQGQIPQQPVQQPQPAPKQPAELSVKPYTNERAISIVRAMRQMRAA